MTMTKKDQAPTMWTKTQLVETLRKALTKRGKVPTNEQLNHAILLVVLEKGL